MSGDCCDHSLTNWLYISAFIIIATAIYSKFFRAKVFAYLLNGFATQLQLFLEPGKKKIFVEAFGKLKETRLKIVEIGVGTGTNFKYYPENAEIIISDKSENFLPYLNETLKKINREDLKINEFKVNNAENMNIIESNSMDAVVATFTLCSINDLSAVFNEINRVLKNGGVFIFMDHSKNTNNILMNGLQTIIEPFWSFIFDDCRFRDIKGEFNKHSKFEHLEIREYIKCRGTLGFMLNPIIYGYAQKEA
jgi:SAM-dependent methyltransferase